MRRALAFAVLTCLAIPLSAWAQLQPTVTPYVVPQGQATAKAAIARCGQLLALIASNPDTAGVSIAQARQWAAQQDVENCAGAAQRIIDTVPRTAR